jgi:hypothetical protein
VTIRAGRRYEQRLDSNVRPCSSTVDGIETSPRVERDDPEGNRFAGGQLHPELPRGHACPRADSNGRPPASETGALPLRYEGMVRAERFELPKREGNRVTAGPTSPSVARPLGVTDGT